MGALPAEKGPVMRDASVHLFGMLHRSSSAFAGNVHWMDYVYEKVNMFI